MTVLKNINSWRTKTQSMKDRIKSSATSYVQRQVLTVLKEAVRVSPQWSGNYAANWKLEVNRQQGHYDPIFKQANWQDIRPPKYAGHPAAIAAAIAYSNDEYIKGLIKCELNTWVRAYFPDMSNRNLIWEFRRKALECKCFNGEVE